jgi:hypothetical protein
MASKSTAAKSRDYALSLSRRMHTLKGSSVGWLLCLEGIVEGHRIIFEWV